jgi:sulfane dehydrogenase subunit SoxC
VGKRSGFAELQRVPALEVASFTPLEKLHGQITPADLHFERHHAGIPVIDPAHHELLLHGMVERPLKFSVEELMRFPAVTRTCFIECSGNYFPQAGDRSPPHLVCGLTSQSEWTGVPLSTLLREAGVRGAASWIIAEGSDAAVLNRSVPLAKAWDDALVVYAQNGEAIRPAQGYPVRLLLPGWEGNTNVKWLRRLEVTDAPVMSREETSKYTEPMRDGSIRQFSFELDARSIITSPSFPGTIEPGWREIRGIAWSGRGRIARVDVSTNGGKTWLPASLQSPVLAKAHTRFGLAWKWNGEATEILSRAVDETGYMQPTLREIVKARGPGSGPYHFNPITGWEVRRDGELRFSPTG